MEDISRYRQCKELITELNFNELVWIIWGATRRLESRKATDLLLAKQQLERETIAGGGYVGREPE